MPYALFYYRLYANLGIYLLLLPAPINMPNELLHKKVTPLWS